MLSPARKQRTSKIATNMNLPILYQGDFGPGWPVVLEETAVMIESLSEVDLRNAVLWPARPAEQRRASARSLGIPGKVWDGKVIRHAASVMEPLGVGGGEQAGIGKPDCSTMDTEGYLWNFRYYGGCIVRVAPDGAIDRIVEMPVQNIPTCTFGGPDRKTLYVTTGRERGACGRPVGGRVARDSDGSRRSAGEPVPHSGGALRVSPFWL